MSNAAYLTLLNVHSLAEIAKYYLTIIGPLIMKSFTCRVVNSNDFAKYAG